MGLSEREYMRPPNATRRAFSAHPATWSLIGLNVAFFFVQTILAAAGRESEVLSYFLLWKGGIESGCVWSIFTYALFHGGLLHLLFNCVAIRCAGGPVEQSDGIRRMLTVYWGGVAAGALFWLALAFAGNSYSPCLGASAGAFALFAYVLMKKPEQVIRLFVFIFPLPAMRARNALWMLVGVSAFFLLTTEIPHATGWWKPLPDVFGASQMAHSAHLGGAAWGIGMVFFKKFLSLLPTKQREKFRVSPLKQSVAVSVERESRPEAERFRQTVEIRMPSKEEADRILDKISTSGLKSLTPEELRTLEQTSRFLKRR